MSWGRLGEEFPRMCQSLSPSYPSRTAHPGPYARCESEVARIKVAEMTLLGLGYWTVYPLISLRICQKCGLQNGTPGAGHVAVNETAEVQEEMPA